MNKVLRNLTQASIRIAEAKSQFCQANLKIVGYISDIADRNLNTWKILKILNWLKCINVTVAYAFMEICIYYQIWI